MSPNDHDRIWNELGEHRQDIRNLTVASERGLIVMENLGARLIEIEQKQYKQDIREAQRKGQASVYGSLSGGAGGILTALALELLKAKLGY